MTYSNIVIWVGFSIDLNPNLNPNITNPNFDLKPGLNPNPDPDPNPSLNFTPILTISPRTPFLTPPTLPHLGKPSHVVPHNLGVRALELFDDLKALVKLGEDIHHGAGEQGML